jgi:hypothetical protein
MGLDDSRAGGGSRRREDRTRVYLCRSCGRPADSDLLTEAVLRIDAMAVPALACDESRGQESRTTGVERDGDRSR